MLECEAGVSAILAEEQASASLMFLDFISALETPRTIALGAMLPGESESVCPLVRSSVEQSSNTALPFWSEFVHAPPGNVV